MFTTLSLSEVYSYHTCLAYEVTFLPSSFGLFSIGLPAVLSSLQLVVERGILMLLLYSFISNVLSDSDAI